MSDILGVRLTGLASTHPLSLFQSENKSYRIVTLEAKGLIKAKKLFLKTTRKESIKMDFLFEEFFMILLDRWDESNFMLLS